MNLLNHWRQELQTLHEYRSHDVEGNDLCDLDPGQGEIMFFL